MAIKEKGFPNNKSHQSLHPKTEQQKTHLPEYQKHTCKRFRRALTARKKHSHHNRSLYFSLSREDTTRNSTRASSLPSRLTHFHLTQPNPHNHSPIPSDLHPTQIPPQHRYHQQNPSKLPQKPKRHKRTKPSHAPTSSRRVSSYPHQK